MARRKDVLKRKQALQLRLAGASYRQIADTLGYADGNPGDVWRIVQEELKEVTREPAENVRMMEMERLDLLQMTHWPAARQGDYQATAMVLRIMEMRARYYGLSAPAPSVVMNQTLNQFSSEGVLVIEGETKQAYIAGLRAARGELAPNGSPPRGELPAPQSGALGQQLLDENRPANQGVPAIPDARLNGEVQVPGLVDESGDL
jgi:hypothetical protein